MKKLILKNIDYITNLKSKKYKKEILQKAVNKLNKDRLVIISGLKFNSKTSFVSTLLKKTNSIKSFFYFNKELDNLNKIKDSHDLKILFKYFKEDFYNPKIIILQNINKIKGIKNFLSDIYKKSKYKTIIIGNNIDIDGIENIEIFSQQYKNEDLKEVLRFGQIEEIKIIKNDYYKSFYLKSLKDNIISNDIIYPYNIKSYNDYYNTISFISKLNGFISQRKLHRELRKMGLKITLLTLIDYINSSLNSKLIKRIYIYDLKKQKKITGKAKYFFTDLGIRNSIYGDKLNKDLLIENLIFIELLKKGYKITAGINGIFEFNFIAKKKKDIFYIKYSNYKDKKEIKKDSNKFNKIGDNIKKFILYNEYIKIKENKIGSVNIISLTDFLTKSTSI